MFIEQLQRDPSFFFAMTLVIVFSICLHELAHGLTAVWLGDSTPIEQGRMTLNPLVHMGWLSLACLLIAGIAWGVMPVNERRLRGRYGVALVAAAGPLTNILLATVSLVGLGLWMRLDPRGSADLPRMAANGRYLLWILGVANVLLAIFNLLPVPPLDGSNILRSLAPSVAFDPQRMGLGAYMQIAVVLFCLSGPYLSDFSVRIATGLLTGVRGW